MEGTSRGDLGDDLDFECTSCEVALLNRSRSSSSSLSTSSQGRARRHSPSTIHQRQEELASRVQHLKEEFTDLLTEIRRRKSITDGRGGVGISIQTEFEEEDGEVRKPRKRALSTTSTWSSSSSSGVNEVSSCMARPLTTPTQAALPSTPPHPVSTHRPSKSLLVTDIS
ncbi:hypothetical protein Pmani_025960 [Petrolisthes manimaculis]|uniref:Uncharacterized protein n=1 Tax=Petrolisthes manimaculis TaxID=1843537 RepID=A0AAE1P6T8_9EUCA|nr:hypothetical protein Pmani_025960 [Petrolisthes manimaculis]